MSAGEDKASLVDDFDAQWNAHDEEGVMGWFTDDAVVSTTPAPPGESGTYTGKEEIRGWIRKTLPGFHVESKSHEVSGDTVTSEVKVASDNFPVDEVEATAETVFRDEKIEALHITFSAKTVAKVQAAMKSGEK